VHGIDDVRVFTVRRGDMQAYVPGEYMDVLQHHFRYIFDPTVQPPKGSSKPSVRLQEIEEGRALEIVGETFLPVKVPHGDVSVYGFRVRGLGYVTDAKLLPDAALDALRGVDVLVLNALWFGKPHASHFNIEEAIEASRVVEAKRTYLTHLTHRVKHAELEERLPEGVYAAFDGLVVEID
jgi:phosphoribosyl 1,2-cyclic phosphate phosphodiesterase